MTHSTAPSVAHQCASTHAENHYDNTVEEQKVTSMLCMGNIAHSYIQVCTNKIHAVKISQHFNFK